MANPTLTFYHANAKGTGSACRFQLHPAKDGDDGRILMEMVSQKTTDTCPHYDWGNSIIVGLDFGDLCKMLQVFHGECETIEDGRGMFHRIDKCVVRIRLSHVIEPVCGYRLEVNYKNDDAPECACSIFFNNYEALGLCEAIAGSMSAICFGNPNVCE